MRTLSWSRFLFTPLILVLGFGIWLRAGYVASGAEEVRILSLSHNGVLTWTNSSLNVTCRVEWAPSVDGPWFSSWAALTNLVVTNHVMSVAVPMFYRIVCTTPPAPVITNITTEAAVAMLEARFGQPDFVILDVRTPTEFNARHIRGAVNHNIFDADFCDQLDALDKSKAYLVYCASGNRSARAVDIMRELDFQEVYNMLGGFSTFVNTPGAAAWLEP